jgi:CO/xanthine dehydrogenase Mo-binding subunit/aerobic-type carbon monoxide dehydrogenase small subunit (CoxS/CutS family)
MTNFRRTMTRKIQLNVNGRHHEIETDPATPLLTILRNDLKLSGPKFGCGVEQCGACKVLVDGQAVTSCKLPVANVAGLEIVTVAGLGSTTDPHPLQQAFIETQAIQCGYCASGMIIAAQGLLNRHRYPTDEQIRQALDDNLCRCGVYDRVRRAVKLYIGREEEAAISVLKQPVMEEASASPQALPGALAQHPELDAWIRINEEGTVTVFTGKVEFGQGIKTAVAQIAAGELDVALERIEVVMADTARTPDEGSTVGSMSLQTSGRSIRQAAAEARYHLLAIAFEELEAPLERLVVADGTISDTESGRQVTYWQLLGGKRFGTNITGAIPPKTPAGNKIVGQAAKRLDLPGKLAGEAAYVHDLSFPGMVHARAVRPPNHAARLHAVDHSQVEGMPGVLKVVRDGSFLGVIAEREEQAAAAAEALASAADWHGAPGYPPQERLFEFLEHSPGESFLVVDGTPAPGPVPEKQVPAGAVQTVNAAYTRPYQMHGSLGPSAAVAHMEAGQLRLWVHSQGAYPLQGVVAQVLEMRIADVRVSHVEGPGCYGHNGADDAALDAALLARAFPGRPISLKWTRGDEHGWEPYGPAMLVKMQGSLDEGGQIIDWNHDVTSFTHLGRSSVGEGTSGLLAAWHLAKPLPPPQPVPRLSRHVGIHRNADPIYNFKRRRIVKHFRSKSLFRTSSMRGLGAYGNIFALESFMDEMAHAAGADPVQFRLRHLDEPRARAVVEAAAAKAGWGESGRDRETGYGRGFAFAQYKNIQTYAAIVVDLHLDLQSGAIRLDRVIIAADSGQVVNPDGLANQLEGGFVQGASWTLYEQVTFDASGIRSLDWDSYPILRFSNAPVIETVLLDRPDQPFLGGGEATQGPAPAAIANAIYDAAGIRLRDIPFTPERVLAALAARE